MKRPPKQWCDDCKRVTGHVRGRRPMIEGVGVLLADAGPHCLPCLRYIVRQAQADPAAFEKATGYKMIDAATQPAAFGRTRAKLWPAEHAKDQ